MLAKCNLKLAERLAECYYDDLDREQIEPNPRVVKCNLKLADTLVERLVERLVEHCDEEKMKGVKLLPDEYIMTIGLVMTAFGTGIVGYFGGGMTIEDIMAVWGIGVYGYCVGELMSKT